MTKDEIVEIVSKCKFSEFEFIVHGDDRFHLQARFETPDGPQYSRKWYISNQACKNEIVNTVFKCVMTAVEHEVREHFKYRGQAIFNPHFDPDVLVEMMDTNEIFNMRETI